MRTKTTMDARLIEFAAAHPHDSPYREDLERLAEELKHAIL
jgi:hypothetical protein